ncbi:MAG: DnaA N-terminal domain-containing protein, partial [Candidatus Omnitrophota bacterium]
MAEKDPSVWLKAQDILRKELDNEQTFNIWFAPIKYVVSTDNTLTLEVPNKFFRDWLLGRYMELINTSILKSFGAPLKIDFLLKEAGVEGTIAAPDKRDVKKEAKTFWPFAKEKQDTAKEVGLNPKYTFDNFVVG